MQIKIGQDWSHTDRMRTILKNMHAVTTLRAIPYPYKDTLTPENIDLLEGTDLEEALVGAALPSVDVKLGGPPGKIQKFEIINKKTRKKQTRLVFHDRKHVVVFAMESLERTIVNMTTGNQRVN